MSLDDLLRELRRLAHDQADAFDQEVCRAAVTAIRDLRCQRKPAAPADVRGYFSALGKVGGTRGGRARWQGTTLEERQEASRRMSDARYGRRSGSEQ